MKTTHGLLVSLAILLQVATGAPAEEEPPGNRAELVLLEKRLLGTWEGPACGGDYTFRANHTYEVRHYTPGNNTLTGTWAVQWNALPPTLVLTCKTSDIQARNPDRPEYQHLGKPLKTELLILNNEAMMFRLPDDEGELRFERPVEDLPKVPQPKIPVEALGAEDSPPG